MATYANPNTLDASNSIDPLLRPSTKPYPMGDGTPGTVTLRDYQHAARIFVDGNFQLSPKYGFLFYVEFDFNPLITNVSNKAAQEMGMIVKNVTLPKYSMDVKVHNAYNRKNLVQNAIKYDPVNITFHDDQADNVRSFWYDYYSFFYRDSDYNDATYNLISKYQERPSFEWGYTPRPVASFNSGNAYQSYQYIQAIRIYSLYQKNFSEYELINPIITNFQHGEHNASEGTGLLDHKMTVQFETVKYYSGYVTQNTVGGFVDLHYDNTTSPIAPAAGPNIVNNGAGGYAAAPDTVLDLANYNLSTAGGSVVPTPASGAQLNASGAFSSIVGSLIGGAAGAGTNAGGFALPGIGSLVSGVSSGSIIGQQITAAAVGLAGQAASSLAGGIVNGITGGNASGSAVLGMVAGAIKNPAAALATVESMATNALMTSVTGGINSLLSSATPALSSSLSSNGLVQGISSGITKLTTAISDEAKAIQKSVDGLVTDAATALGISGASLPTASSLTNSATSAAGTVAAGASSLAGTATSAVTDAVNSATTAVSGAVTSATNAISGSGTDSTDYTAGLAGQ